MPFRIGLWTQTACIWEVMARKPGNVNRSRDFTDMTVVDFLTSAAVLTPFLISAPERAVGRTIMQAILARKWVTPRNTNLGIVLLLTPLAKAASETDYRVAVERVLAGLDVIDTWEAYQGIREAAAGGLGQVPEQDIQDEPTISLREAMALAAERDLIARQYANGFLQVFDEGVPALVEGFRQTGSVEEAIILCQLQLMAAHPDSLIARKRGLAEAHEASRRAEQVLRAGWPETNSSWTDLSDFDRWLRVEGHSRNPGTTADLVTACLFVALRERSIALDAPFPWRAGFDHDR